MKIRLVDKDTKQETEYEFPPIGEGKAVKFPLLFEPRIGGRKLDLSEVDSSHIVTGLIEKSVGLDPDYRAYYFGEIFCQLMSFPQFWHFYAKHFIVNHVIDPDGRFFCLALEYCPDGVKNLTQEEADLLTHLGEEDED